MSFTLARLYTVVYYVHNIEFHPKALNVEEIEAFVRRGMWGMLFRCGLFLPTTFQRPV